MGTLLLRNVVRDGVSCDIYIKEGVVSSIGRGLAVDADTVLDGGGKTVMPAFVNMHTHSGMTLFRRPYWTTNLSTGRPVWHVWR